jgi:hypothetical protein
MAAGGPCESNERAESPGAFTSLSRRLPIDFTGRRVELRGFLRTEDISNFAGLWIREDGDAGMIYRRPNRRPVSPSFAAESRD